jgi:tetratricopeptide (TPR) repeat protein
MPGEPRKDPEGQRSGLALLETERQDLIQRLASGKSKASAIRAIHRTESLAEELAAAGMDLIRTDLSQASRLAKAALICAEAAASPSARAKSSRLLAHTHLLRGRPSLALPLYADAASAFEGLGMEDERAITLSASVQALIYEGRTEDAFAAADEAEEIFQRLSNRLRLARLQVNVANALHRLGRAAEALPKYRAALEVLREEGAHQDSAIVLRNLAVCLMALHRLEEAADLYEQAGAYFQREGLTLLEWEVKSNQAYLFGRQGDYRRALQQYRLLLTQSETGVFSEAGFEVGNALLDMAEFMAEIGLMRDALAAGRRSQAVFQKLDLGAEQGKAQFICALALASLGRTQEARKTLGQAARRLRSLGSPVWMSLCRLLTGRLNQQQGRRKAAYRDFSLAASLTSSAGSEERKAEILLALADSALSIELLPEAQEALSQAPVLKGTLQEPQSWWLRARISLAQEDPSRGWKEAQTAVSLLETCRQGLGAPGLRTALQNHTSAIYEEACRLSPTLEDRFLSVQQAKARTLRDLLDAGPVGRQSPKSETLRGRIRYVEHLLASEDLNQNRSLQEAESLRSSRMKWEEELAEEERLSRLEEGVQPLSQPLTLDEVRRFVGPRHALVEWTVIGEEIRAIVITSEGVEDRSLGAAAAVGPLKEGLLFHLGRGLAGSPSRGRADCLRIFDQLGALLLDPLSSSLGDRSVTLMPHGVLHGLPLHSLPLNGQPLCLTRFVSYAPSASVWAGLRTRLAHQGAKTRLNRGPLVMASGDHLAPSIETEARFVAQALPGARLFLGHEAGLEALAREAEGSSHLHLACHGVFREDQPLFSSVRLGQDSVCALDVLRLPINSGLVYLSGCSTALSDVGPGDEASGLIPSFFAAGAPRIIGTLWDANDEASLTFANAFYGSLTRGKGVEDSYLEGCARTREEHSHPALWAPFAAFGHFG